MILNGNTMIFRGGCRNELKWAMEVFGDRTENSSIIFRTIERVKSVRKVKDVRKEI